MNRVRVARLLSVCWLALAACKHASVPAVANDAVMRVGTYHAPSLVLAWYRSQDHAKEVNALVAAREAAMKAGDSKKAAELERIGAEAQDLAHRQLAGQAGIEDILGRLAGDLPTIAKAAGVDRIHAEGEVLGDRVEFVDITDRLVELFHPDEATRKLLSEVRKSPRGLRVH